MNLLEFMRRRGEIAPPTPPLEGLRRARADDRRRAREMRRTATLDARRGTLVAATPATPAKPPTPAKRAPVDVRRLQLEEWRRRRALERTTAPKPRPPFRAGVVRHDPAPFAPFAEPPPNGRVTRASAKRALRGAASSASFAPPGAGFRPPTLRPKVRDAPDKMEIVEKIQKTPERQAEIAILKSPYVAMTRGKTKLPSPDTGYSKNGTEKTARYFRLQLDNEIARLLDLADRWNSYKEANRLPDGHADSVDVAVGQTRLLVDKKFRQFRGLVERCESGEIVDGEGLVNVDDLQGFWDMVYMQVEDLDIKFNNLKKLKENNWQDDAQNEQVQKKKKISTKNVAPKNVKGSSGLKAMILAKRKLEKESNSDKTVTFDGGFFSVTSPIKEKVESNSSTPSRELLRRSVLSTEANKHISFQSPLSVKAILTATSFAKCIANNEPVSPSQVETSYYVQPVDLNKTPGKSILKTPLADKTKAKISKKNVKLAFSPEDPIIILSSNENKENQENRDEDNVEEPAKRQTRHSKRILSKQANIELSSPDDLNLNRMSLKSERVSLILEFSPKEGNDDECHAEASESFMEVFGLSNETKRRSTKKSNPTRRSNLITLDSPVEPTYTTRSTVRKSINEQK